MSIAIGVYVHAEPLRLRATLAALAAHTCAAFDLLLLPDGPDTVTRAALSRMQHLAQSATDAPRGPAACFNRLIQETTAERLILLESGTLVSPGWLEKLLGALDVDAQHGLACPSTNRAWNQLAVFPDGGAVESDIVRTAAEADQRFGETWQSLAPLWDVADFCLAAKRAAVDAVGFADEAYGEGPCWEMDYAVRAARAGFPAVWARGAYVYRHPFTARRQREETRRFEASRRRYQDKFCGLRLSGARQTYSQHCRGELCSHFAPPANIVREPIAVTAPIALAIPVAVITSPTPLVSCIMPTSGRPDWLLQSIQYFLRQDYPSLELIIVDASPDERMASLPDDPRIHHRRIRAGSSIGEMRNLACELARGDIIIHWDDDDWYGERRVTAQVRPILHGLADITALTDTPFFDLNTWKFWRCAPHLHRRLFVLDVHGGTLAFRRTLFGSKCRYPNLSLAEDAYFLQNTVAQGARLARIPSDDHFVYLRHTGNAWSFQCGSYLDARGWRLTVEPDSMAKDRAFYVARSPAAARDIAPVRRPVVVEVTAPVASAAPVSIALTAGRNVVRAPAIPSSPPLASCIMPTANRRPFVRNSIDLFLAQDYPVSELIILDDGEDPVGDLVPSHPAVRYLYKPRYRSLGAKRNAACEVAQGDIILHWDDDDWYAPHRIRTQVDALCTGDAELCGLDRVLFFDPRKPAAWEYIYPAGGAPWVYGATLCYRRDFWRAHPFLDITIGEDNMFSGAARAAQLRALQDNRFFVALVHATNTSPKQVRDPRWRPCEVAAVHALTGPDWPPVEGRRITANRSLRRANAR